MSIDDMALTSPGPQSILPPAVITILEALLNILKITLTALNAVDYFPLSELLSPIIADLNLIVISLDLILNDNLPIHEIKVKLQSIHDMLAKIVDILSEIPVVSYLVEPLQPYIKELQDIIDSLPDSN